MKKEYDFSKAKRAPVIPQKGKTRITIYIDDDVLQEFRDRADEGGSGYQTMINEALREYLSRAETPLGENSLRRILREELHSVGSSAIRLTTCAISSRNRTPSPGCFDSHHNAASESSSSASIKSSTVTC